MATARIKVALEDRQLEEVRNLVASGQAISVSGFVRHAIAVALADAADWRQMLDEGLRETGGPLTPEERSWADSILSPPKP